MWCDLFLFLRPMAAMPQGVPAGLGKRVQSFPAGVPGAERTRQGGKAPTCKDRQGGCMGRQDRAPHPLFRTGSHAGAASPHRTARAGENGFSGRRVSCARR